MIATPLALFLQVIASEGVQKEWGEANGWVVVGNAGACSMATGWKGTEIDLSLSSRFGDPFVGMLVTDQARARQGSDGQVPDLRVQLDGKRVELMHARVAFGTKGGYAIIVDRAILDSLTGAAKMDISIGGASVFSLDVAGSGKAVQLLRACVADRQDTGAK